MHHQKRVAVHLLIVIGAYLDGKLELAYGGIHIHGHGFRGRPGQARFVAGPPVTGALLAKTAGVHEQQKRPLMAVDVYSTVRQFGFPIRLRTDYDQQMDRYAFLMIH